MPPVPPDIAILLADVILGLHAVIASFVVFGTLAIVVGGLRGWSWVRNRAFRIAHLALMAFIALQAWLGRLCPLTVLEQALRNRAGQATYDDSFIQHWLSRMIFLEAPWWSFVATYTVFAALAIACWRWLPPHRRRPRMPGRASAHSLRRRK